MAALGAFGAAMAILALLVVGALYIYDLAAVPVQVARGALLCRTQVVAVDTLSVVLLDVRLVVEHDPRQPVAGLVQGYDRLH